MYAELQPVGLQMISSTIQSSACPALLFGTNSVLQHSLVPANHIRPKCIVQQILTERGLVQFYCRLNVFPPSIKNAFCL